MATDRFEYKYECPTKRGFKKFRVSKRDQNRIFKYRKARWSHNYEFYVMDETIIMQRIPSVRLCLLATIALPLSVFLCGVVNYKKIYRESVVDTWNAKEQGAFSSNGIRKRKGDDTFERVISCAIWV